MTASVGNFNSQFRLLVPQGWRCGSPWQVRAWTGEVCLLWEKRLWSSGIKLRKCYGQVACYISVHVFSPYIVMDASLYPLCPFCFFSNCCHRLYLTGCECVIFSPALPLIAWYNMCLLELTSCHNIVVTRHQRRRTKMAYGPCIFLWGKSWLGFGCTQDNCITLSKSMT